MEPLLLCLARLRRGSEATVISATTSAYHTAATRNAAAPAYATALARACKRFARVPTSSGGNLDGRLDNDRDIEGESGNAWCGTGVVSGLAPELEN